MLFDVDDLLEGGFEGFLPVESLKGPEPQEIPTSSGVYAILRATEGEPGFLDGSKAGRWKGKDPSVSLERLRREWVEDAQTLYLGRATCLRTRVGLLLDFGRGSPVMHYGGRLLWQVGRWGGLLVAWREESGFVAHEANLIDEFIDHFGRLPFANLRRGDRTSK